MSKEIEQDVPRITELGFAIADVRSNSYSTERLETAISKFPVTYGDLSKDLNALFEVEEELRKARRRVADLALPNMLQDLKDLKLSKELIDACVQREYKHSRTGSGFLSAIRLCRSLTGKDLVDAKQYVEKLCNHKRTMH